MKTILSLKDIKIGAIEIGEFTVEEDMTLIEAVGCSKEIERLCYSFIDKLNELGIDFTNMTNKTDWKIKEVKSDKMTEEPNNLNTKIDINKIKENINNEFDYSFRIYSDIILSFKQKQINKFEFKERLKQLDVSLDYFISDINDIFHDIEHNNALTDNLYNLKSLCKIELDKFEYRINK